MFKAIHLWHFNCLRADIILAEQCHHCTQQVKGALISNFYCKLTHKAKIELVIAI